jgi:hypothetical protein
MKQEGKYIKDFLKLLLPYLWPNGRIDLRVRVSFSVIALLLAKNCTSCLCFSLLFFVRLGKTKILRVNRVF